MSNENQPDWDWIYDFSYFETAPLDMHNVGY